MYEEVDDGVLLSVAVDAGEDETVTVPLALLLSVAVADAVNTIDELSDDEAVTDGDLLAALVEVPDDEPQIVPVEVNEVESEAVTHPLTLTVADAVSESVPLPLRFAEAVTDIVDDKDGLPVDDGVNVGEALVDDDVFDDGKELDVRIDVNDEVSDCVPFPLRLARAVADPMDENDGLPVDDGVTADEALADNDELDDGVLLAVRDDMGEAVSDSVQQPLRLAGAVADVEGDMDGLLVDDGVTVAEALVEDDALDDGETLGERDGAGEVEADAVPHPLTLAFAVADAADEELALPVDDAVADAVVLAVDVALDVGEPDDAAVDVCEIETDAVTLPVRLADMLAVSLDDKEPLALSVTVAVSADDPARHARAFDHHLLRVQSLAEAQPIAQ